MPTATAALLLISILTTFTHAQTENRFTIRGEQTLAPDFVGFGVQMNPYLYCNPNYFGVSTFRYRMGSSLNGYFANVGDVTEQNVIDLERKIIALAPQHVRIFCLNEWWTPQSDPRIGRNDPRMRQSLIRTARLAQRAGATINLQLWYGRLLRDQPEEAARQFTNVLVDLIERQKITAIRYVTLQNEVNGEGPAGAMRISLANYSRLYRSLHENLIRVGLRDHICIVGGDLVSTYQSMWFHHMANDLPDVLDGHSVHIYWDYWDTAKLMWRLNGVIDVVDTLPASGRKPLYITEFGVRGFRPESRIEPGTYWDSRPIADTNTQALQTAWFMIESVNRGFLTLVIWDAYDIWYDRRMGYGVIGAPLDGWPLKPSYHMLRLFTQTAGPGWRSVKVDGGAQYLSLAAMRDGARDWTVYSLNRAEQSQIVELSGLPTNTTFQVVTWNADGSGKNRSDNPLRSNSAGEMSLEIEPLSIIALTTKPAPPVAIP